MSQSKRKAGGTNAELTAPTRARSKQADVLDARYHDIGPLLHPDGSRRQPLRGFQEDYVDIVHYIVKCTHDIWEGRGIGLIYTHYTQNARVHSSDGMTYGRDAMVENTIQRQAAFPNARAYADDVIWSGNDRDGFHSSHRVYHISRNTGYSMYGPPTGRTVRRYGVAHCLVLENLIVEEWLVHDNLGIIRCLGLDPHAWARHVVESEAATGAKAKEADTFGDLNRLRGQEPPRKEPEQLGGPAAEARMHRSIHEIWNLRRLDFVDAYYAPNVTCYTTGNRILCGRGDYRHNLTSLLAAFPDAVIRVDHTCSLPLGDDGHRVAARWTFMGTHTGPGWYGRPTGKRVKLLGTTHAEVVDGKIVKEWLVYDEIAILKQILRPA